MISRTGMSTFLGLVALVTGVELALGVWQWNRRAEKAAFIAEVKAAATSQTRALQGAPNWSRVAVEGQFLPGKVAYVISSRPAPKPGERDSEGRVPVSGFGVHVMAAFVAEDCSATPCQKTTLLINRGFLPTPASGAIPPTSTPEGKLRLVGFVRPSEREGVFPPKNEPEKDRFFFRTSEAIAARLNLPSEPHGYRSFLDREAEPGEIAGPRGVQVQDFLKAIPNNHFEYALTWWALAATNLLTLLAFLISRRKKAVVGR